MADTNSKPVYRIMDLHEADRPRERLASLGPQALTNAELIAILKRLATAVAKYQDQQSGLWYQVVDKAGSKGNYFESSAAAMFVYALAKGAHMKYLPASSLRVAEKGYRAMLSQFVETKPDGLVDYKGTVSVAGLGGNPYRDGSYEYYLSEKVVTNDPKGYGAFIMAAAEMEPAKKKKKG